MKNYLLIILGFVLILTACGQKPATAEPTPTNEPTQTVTEAPATPTSTSVTVVTSSGQSLCKRYVDTSE